MRKISLWLTFLSSFLLCLHLVVADSPQPKILLVLDSHYDPTGLELDWNEILAPYFIQALEANGLAYDNCTVEDATDDGPGYDVAGCEELRMMKDYDIVIWFTGTDWTTEFGFPTLTDDDRVEIAEYLANGGMLFLTGQDIGFDIGTTTFYKSDPLLATFCLDNATDSFQYTLQVYGANDPIGAGFTMLNKLNITGIYTHPLVGWAWSSLIFRNYTRYYITGENKWILEWHPTTQPIFMYEGYIDVGKIKCADGWDYRDLTDYDPDITGLGAIRVNTGGPFGYKIVYFSFGFEQIVNTPTCLDFFGRSCREELMRRVFGYLSGPAVRSTKFYARNLENTGWEDLNITCHPADTYCLRPDYPLLNATCTDRQLFSNVTGAEYNISDPDAPEPPRLTYQSDLFVQMDPSDGAFDFRIENVNKTFSYPFLDEGLYRAWVHCNDTDNFYGKFDYVYFTVDRTVPYFATVDPIVIEDGRRYTNKTEVKVTVSAYINVPPYYSVDYVAFSCNGTAWTEWIPFGEGLESIYYVDITNASIGCPSADGNRTLYVKIRDEAGNLGLPQQVSEWIILDRVAPQIINIYRVAPGLQVALPNRSSLRSTDNISITFYDPLAPDGTHANVHVNMSWNGSVWIYFFNATSFDHGWRTEGIKNLTVFINDTAGNVNLTRYQFVVDDTPPSIVIDEPIPSVTYSGIVDLLTTITDRWSSIDTAWYEIRNASNLSQVFVPTTILNPPDYDTTWDSTTATSQNDTFFFNVSANDTLGWTTFNVSVSFYVDNRLPSVEIVYPDKAFINTNFNLNLLTSSPGAPTVNITNASFTISNATWSRSNSTGIINLPSYNFTDFINLSAWCEPSPGIPGVCGDGNYTIYLWANNTESLTSSTTSWFIIDTTPPSTTNYSLNISLDPYFGDRRIYHSEAVRFTVNLTDPRKVDTAIVTLRKPVGEVNLTLSLLTGTTLSGIWQHVITRTADLGTYNLTKLYVNDTLGNLFINQSVNMSFSVVNVTLFLTLNNLQEIDAAHSAVLNLTLNFNKTISDPYVKIYVPPNQPGATNITPHYSNLTLYSCFFGTACTLEAYRDTQPYPTWLNVSGTGSGHMLFVNATLLATTPMQDTYDWWVAEWEIVYSNFTKIKTPFLQVEGYCDGNPSCVVYQNQAFNFTLNITNLYQAGNHTGKAVDVYGKFNSTALTIDYAEFVGNVSSSSYTLTSPYQMNITEAGNYTFTLKAWDNLTKQYNATKLKVVEVKDTEPPVIVSTAWGEDNVINVNETIVYFVEVSDNVAISTVWLTLNQSTGVVKNHTLTLYIGTPPVKHGIWKLSYDNTSWTGNYTILRIYANDTEGNVGESIPTGILSWFEVRDLIVNASVLLPSLVVGNNQTIFANATGNGSAIQTVNALILKPRQYNESVTLQFHTTYADTYPIYAFNGTYTNVSRSGNYTVRVNVTLVSGISKVGEVNFSSPFGNVSIQVDPYLYLPVNLGPYNLSWWILPENGDLLSVNGTLSIENVSVLNLSVGEPNFKSFGDIYWELWKWGYLALWEINVTDVVGVTNITLNVTSATPSQPLARQNASETMTVEVIPLDVNPPIIWEFDQQLSRLNLFEANRLWVNATDNETVVGVVLAEIDYPVAGLENKSLSAIAPDLWAIDFSNTNETGNFSWKLFVCDIAGNCNVSTSKQFEVFDTYYVDLSSDYSIYNKGEIVTLSVRVQNVNGVSVSDFNLTLKLNKDEPVNITLVDNQIADQAIYQILPTDKPQTDEPATYIAYAEVHKQNNSGVATTQFQVSKVLPTHFVSPVEGQYFPTNASINVSVSVTNQRGEVVDDAAVLAYCEYCDRYYIALTWYPPAQAYVAFPAFNAPTVERFSIAAVSVDYWKNTDPGGPPPYVGLTTVPPPAALPPPAPPPPACECTAWEDVGCGYGECGPTELYQIRSCTPIGCASESRCIAHPRCVLAFEFTIEPIELEIPQGETKVVTATLKNLGEAEMTAVVSLVDKKCKECTVDFVKEHVLAAKEERDFTVRIHVRLNESFGSYGVTLRATGTLPGVEPILIEKKFTIAVTIQEQSVRLERLELRLDELKSAMREYEKVGVDITEIVALVERIEEVLKSAHASIHADDLPKLREANDEAEKLLRNAEARLFGLWLRKWLLEHKEFILTDLILGFLTAYWITQVTLPYRKLGKEVAALRAKERELVKAREAAEMDYFRRRIDEATFRAIMTERQSEIIRTREAIKLKVKERSELVVKRLSPVFFARWVIALPANLARKFKNMLRRIFQKVKEASYMLKWKLRWRTARWKSY